MKIPYALRIPIAPNLTNTVWILAIVEQNNALSSTKISSATLQISVTPQNLSVLLAAKISLVIQEVDAWMTVFADLMNVQTTPSVMVWNLTVLKDFVLTNNAIPWMNLHLVQFATRPNTVLASPIEKDYAQSATTNLSTALMVPAALQTTVESAATTNATLKTIQLVTVS